MRTQVDKGSITKILLILVTVFLSYSNALKNRFASDDLELVVGNPAVKHLWNIPHIFTSGYWDVQGITGGLYRPFTIFTFLVEYSMAGLNPFIYHMDNVLLHALCSILVYLILREMRVGSGVPLLAALLFAAHPVHSEAVAWVSGRAELLWSAFALLSIFIFIKGAERAAYTTLSVLCFSVALLSKETAVVVPLLLCLYLFLYTGPRPGQSRTAQLASRLWPYLLVSAVFLAVRAWVIGGLGPNIHEQTLYGLQPYDRFLLMSKAFSGYMKAGLLPVNLSVAYFFPPPGSLIEAEVLFPILLLGIMLAFAGRIIRCSRSAFFWVAWFFITLLPVSNIIPVGILMSDRAIYMPSFGVCVALGLLIRRAASLTGLREGRDGTLSVLIVVPVVALLASVTLGRNPIWHNDESYKVEYMQALEGSIRAHPGDPALNWLLARKLIRFNDFGQGLDEALGRAEPVLGLDDPDIRAARAKSYEKRSMDNEALVEIKEAIRLDPQPDYYGFAGVLLTRLKKYAEAEAMLDKAIAINPNRAAYYLWKGDIRMELGDDEGALGLFERASVIDPDNEDAYLEQGIVLDSKRRFGEAIEKIKKAVSLKPDVPDLHYFLATAYMDAGMPGEARKELVEAIRLRPGYPEAYTLLQKVR